MPDSITSLIRFITALFFVFLGVICLLLSWSPTMRTDFVQFVFQNSVMLGIFGLGFVAIGLSLVINTILNIKREYYLVETDNCIISIDENLFTHYLKAYFAEQYPHQEIPFRAQLKKNQLKLFVDLPFLSPNQRPSLLEKLQSNIKEILHDSLGFKGSLSLLVSFQSER